MTKFNQLLVFLIPVFLSLPDLSIDIGGVINLRIDDILVYLFFLLNIHKVVVFKKSIFLKIQYLMFFYAFLSLLYVILVKPWQVNNYDLIRYLGSLPYLIAFPYILQSPKYRKLLFKGAFFGGMVYLILLSINYSEILKQDIVFQKTSALKSKMSFITLNPNSVAGIALIFAWLNILSYVINTKKIFQLIIGVFLLSVPIIIFARGYSIGVFTSIIVIVLLRKKSFKHIVYYIIGSLFVLFVLSFLIDETLFRSAYDINVNTGKGFSGRYELWYQGINLLMKNPITGNGFTTEQFMYRKYYAGHMSHQILLRNSIELGLINLIIFLIFIFGLLKNRFVNYKKTSNITYLIQFSILLCFFVADMSAQLLYFNKYEYIIYSMVLFNIYHNNNHIKRQYKAKNI